MQDTQEEQIIFAELLTNNQQKIGVARLNRPKALNALSFNMLKLLTQQLKAWQSDADIVAVWLESSLEKSFCAGGDLLEVFRARKEFTDDDEKYLSSMMEYFATEYELDYLIHTYSKPVFVFGRGLTMGGGMGLFQGAKYRLVTDNSKLAMPETKIGLFPDVGATWFYNKLPLYLTLFLSLTGISINAKDALELGLADYYLPQKEHENLFNLLMELDWDNSQASEAKIHEFLDKFNIESANLSSQVLPIASQIQKLCIAELDDVIIDNLLNYAGDNAFLLEAKELIKSASPTSLKLTAQLMRNMRNKTLQDALQLDFVITTNSALKGEFVEGIRSLIIDKDQQPNWHFKNHRAVSLDWLGGFFALPANYQPLNLRED